MSQNEIRKIIRFYIACLKEDGVKVSKAVLFGSQAKGTSKKESDIDVESKHPTFKNYFGLKEGLEKAIGRRVDLLFGFLQKQPCALSREFRETQLRGKECCRIKSI